jgi:predicted RND superfamily exporter protein
MAGEMLRWDVALRRRIEAAFENWGHLAHSHPWPIIFGMALLPCALAFQLPRVEVEMSIEHFLDEGHPAQVAYNEFRDRYGRDELILLGLEAPDVFDLQFLERLRSLHEALEEEVPHLDEVTSLFNVRETRGEDEELIVGDLLEQWPETPDERMAIRERALANPLYHNYLLTRDGSFTTIVIKTSAFSDSGSDLGSLSGFDDTSAREQQTPSAYLSGAENSEAAAAVLSTAERFESESFSISVAGGPMMEHVLMQQLSRNIVVFMSLSLLAVAFLLYLLFRRVTAVLLPLLVVLLSIISTFGCMPLLGTKVGIPTQILPSFLLAVGVGGAVHLLTIFFQRYDAGASREEALCGALHHSGLAIVMTGLTTAGPRPIRSTRHRVGSRLLPGAPAGLDRRCSARRAPRSSPSTIPMDRPRPSAYRRSERHSSMDRDPLHVARPGHFDRGDCAPRIQIRPALVVSGRRLHSHGDPADR